MKIGLFFGSFNPVHRGHTMIVSKIIDQNFFNQIWIILSPQSPHKTSCNIVKKEHRFVMLKKAFFDQKNVVISKVEFELSKPNFTINTLKHLQQKFPDYIFSIIMGADNFKNIKFWKDYKEIINNHKIYIYPRKGFDFQKNELLNTQYLPFLEQEVSSTLIRNLITNQKKDELPKYLSESVIEYILSKNVY